MPTVDRMTFDRASGAAARDEFGELLRSGMGGLIAYLSLFCASPGTETLSFASVLLAIVAAPSLPTATVWLTQGTRGG